MNRGIIQNSSAINDCYYVYFFLSDVQNSPDDVGNAVLWWPHDVDTR